MDMSNLQASHHSLIEYLQNRGYHSSTIGWAKKCIKLALEIGPHNDVRNYRDIYEKAVEKLDYKPSEGRCRSLKSTFGMLEAFDISNEFPNNRPKGFNKCPDLYDKLTPEFKALAIRHKEVGRIGKQGLKQECTIYKEYRAVVQFLYHFQNRGVTHLEDVNPQDIYSFFYDGSTQIRGYDYRNLVKAFLSHIEGERLIEAKRILGLLPNIPKQKRLYNGLTKEEGERFLQCLEDKENELTLRDRAVGLILYFYGMRGTDISKLSFENINWKSGRLYIKQSKTGRPLSLTLEPIVGNAIFNYMKEVRMAYSNTDSKVIFLKNNGLEPPVDLRTVVYRIFKVAGIRQDSGVKGFRSLRHHFVTKLLSAGESCEVIAKLVGHKDVNTLDRYADQNYEELKKCALDISMFPIDPEVFKV